MRAPAARGSNILPPVRARTETDTYRKRTSHSQWWRGISKADVSRRSSVVGQEPAFPDDWWL